MAIVDCVLDSRAELAEGPVWDPDEGVLYWVNIKAHEIHRFDPATGKDTHWKTPADVGSMGLRQGGGMVVALKTGFFFFDPPTGKFTAIVEPEPDLPDNRFNDGKTDRQGRFWAGTLYDPDESKATGGLYRLDTNLTCHKLVDGIFASNGLAFSPDSKTAYYADSKQRKVWAWDFDAVDGTLSNRRVFIELKTGEGGPDGAAVDDEGCYWLTQPPASLRGALRPEGPRRPRDRDAGLAADLLRLRRPAHGDPLHHLCELPHAGREAWRRSHLPARSSRSIPASPAPPTRVLPVSLKPRRQAPVGRARFRRGASQALR